MPDVELKATPDAQLEAVRGKQAGFTEQLETNTTRAANMSRANVADSFESQKNAAKLAALSAGRPWTNADEMEWSSRKANAAQKAENELVIGREKTISDSMAAEGRTVESQIGQQLQQKQQQISAGELSARTAQQAAELKAQQEYQQAMLKQAEQTAAMQQSRALSELMYGPMGPAQGGVGATDAQYSYTSTPTAGTSASATSAGSAGVGMPVYAGSAGGVNRGLMIGGGTPTALRGGRVGLG